MTLILGGSFLITALAVGGFYVLKNNGVYREALALIEQNDIAQMTTFMAQLSPSKKDKLLRNLHDNAQTLAQTIQSKLMFEVLVKYGYDINHKKTLPKNSLVIAQESLFTFALQERIEAVDTFSTTPLADIMLDNYQYDLNQLKKFEEQIKQSELKIYTPLAQKLQTYKNKLLLEQSKSEFFTSDQYVGLPVSAHERAAKY